MTLEVTRAEGLVTVQDAGRREGRELTHAEIAERVGVPESKVDWVLSTRRYAGIPCSSPQVRTPGPATAASRSMARAST